MVKHFVLLVAVVATLVVVDAAQARGRRGGCPGGNCYATSYSPAKMAVLGETAAPVAADAPAAPAAEVASAPAAAPTYTAAPASRRGWFGWRR
jgi:uncharacterized protein (DUF3084 family)